MRDAWELRQLIVHGSAVHGADGALELLLCGPRPDLGEGMMQQVRIQVSDSMAASLYRELRNADRRRRRQATQERRDE